eukprot:scaffold188615_cov21-Tisochrysis_lutea.AAC.3
MQAGGQAPHDGRAPGSVHTPVAPAAPTPVISRGQAPPDGCAPGSAHTTVVPAAPKPRPERASEGGLVGTRMWCRYSVERGDKVEGRRENGTVHVRTCMQTFLGLWSLPAAWHPSLSQHTAHQYGPTKDGICQDGFCVVQCVLGWNRVWRGELCSSARQPFEACSPEEAHRDVGSSSRCTTAPLLALLNHVLVEQYIAERSLRDLARWGEGAVSLAGVGADAGTGRGAGAAAAAAKSAADDGGEQAANTASRTPISAPGRSTHHASKVDGGSSVTEGAGEGGAGGEEEEADEDAVLQMLEDRRAGG